MTTRPPWMRRGIVLVVTAVLVAACSASVEPTVDEAAPSVPPASSPVTPLQWSACGGVVECATLTVPADWADPTGPSIELAVARRPATGASAGTLFVNPGGPGASAADRVIAGTWPAALVESFDLVSWDPRGVGASTNLDCGGVGGTNGTAVHRNPTDTAGLEAFVSACTTGSPGLVDHLGTSESVADLDALRLAMGIDRLNYLGFSYGTYLGLAYLRAYPDAVRTLVLDGVVNPAEDIEQLLTAQSLAMEQFLVEAADQPDGANLFDLARSSPSVDPDTLAFAAIAASYSPSGAGRLRAALSAATTGDQRGLEQLAESYWSGVSYTAYLATLCSDLPHPEDLAAHAAMTARMALVSPRLGTAIADEVRGCALWPGSTVAPWPATTAGSDAVIIVVGATGDRATPLASAEAVHTALGTGALIIHEADGHTSFDASPCVQQLVIDAVATGAAPPSRSRCVGRAASPSPP